MKPTPVRSAHVERRSPRFSWRARHFAVAAAAVILVSAAVATFLALSSRKSIAPLNPDLVAVATLANETGDPTLAPLGRLAAERVAQGIQQHGVAEVVPPTVALAAAEDARGATDRVGTFAAATGAGVVLHGAYYLLGDSLQFQLQITDAAAGKLMSALAPVTGPREPATETLDLVRERVLGTLAAALELRSGALHVPMQPRSLEVYRVFQQALPAEDAGDSEEAIRLYREAWAMDSTFYPALVLLAAWLQARGLSTGEESLLAEADSLFGIVDGYRDRMSEAERLFLEGFHERRRGSDPDASLARVRRLAQFAPYYSVMAARRAWDAHRPREALELLTRVDTANPNFAHQMDVYWRTGAEAHHMLGRFESALEFARAARRQFPSDLAFMDHHLWSLAALGRIDQFNALLDTVLALPVERRPSGRVWMPDRRAHMGADELRAHGHSEAARRVLQRTIEWLETRPAEEALQEGWEWLGPYYRYSLAECLYELERWEEARSVYEEFRGQWPVGDTLVVAGLGTIAARLGDRELARTISDQLAEKPGGQRVARARIAALLGERQEAMRLLHEQAEIDGRFRKLGWSMRQRHQDIDLEPLHGYPPFELFMRQRG